jgi:very-short-patch-repair endonuclease
LDAVLAFVPLLRPGDRFSHVSAARLWPLPLPWGVTGDTVHVASTQYLEPHRGAGVAGHRTSTEAVVHRRGIPVSDPLTLFIELATLLPEEYLVAVGDALVMEPAQFEPDDLRPWITLDELRTGCDHRRAHGVRRARRAAARVRQGAESPMETALRLLLIDAGLPEPELNQELFDSHGRWIGRFDMVYREQRVIVEYDGDQHRTSTEQYEKDISRIDRAIDDHWRVVRVRSRGIHAERLDTIRRVRDALRSR